MKFSLPACLKHVFLCVNDFVIPSLQVVGFMVLLFCLPVAFFVVVLLDVDRVFVVLRVAYCLSRE